MKIAKFIHGDRVVHMIDVPEEDLNDFIENLRETFGEAGIEAFEAQLKQLRQSKQFIKPKKDD